jgi:SAM-dependent methyltransferase
MIDYLQEDRYPFNLSYNRWRQTRVNKILSIFGNQWDKKEVLELACGYGNIGLYLKSLGANVTFADARQNHLDIVLAKDNTSNVIQIDQDQYWNIHKRFDIIIHFGVLYHLNDWRQDLKCALHHTDNLLLESAVSDSSKEYECKFYEEEEGGQNAFNSIGSLPSALTIENYINDLGYHFKRFDDIDLNTKRYKYDWVVSDPDLSNIQIKSFEDKPLYGGRRFWWITKPPSIS